MEKTAFTIEEKLLKKAIHSTSLLIFKDNLQLVQKNHFQISSEGLFLQALFGSIDLMHYPTLFKIFQSEPYFKKLLHPQRVDKNKNTPAHLILKSFSAKNITPLDLRSDCLIIVHQLTKFGGILKPNSFCQTPVDVFLKTLSPFLEKELEPDFRLAIYREVTLGICYHKHHKTNPLIEVSEYSKFKKEYQISHSFHPLNHIFSNAIRLSKSAEAEKYIFLLELEFIRKLSQTEKPKKTIKIL